jgi:hypothetical protein
VVPLELVGVLDPLVDGVDGLLVVGLVLDPEPVDPNVPAVEPVPLLVVLLNPP